jgi:hypothetical protein
MEFCKQKLQDVRVELRGKMKAVFKEFLRSQDLVVKYLIET